MRLIFPLLLLALTSTAQDTVIIRRVNFPIAPGIEYDSSFIFRLQKPLPVTVVVKDTIYITQCPPPNPLPSGLLRSRFPSIKAWIDSSIAQGRTAILDRNDTIRRQINVNGNLSLYGNGFVLHNTIEGDEREPFMFLLGAGVHRFANLNITQNRSGRAFNTVQNTGIVWTNVFDSVNVWNGRSAYESSRGGTAANPSDLYWRNSIINSGMIAISTFSQDGPFKRVFLTNLLMETDEKYGDNTTGTTGTASHTIYLHPNVSFHFKNLQLNAAKQGLHHHSGSGVPGRNKFTILENVNTDRDMEIVTGQDTTIIIGGTMGLYYSGNRPPTIKATNVDFRNRGSGTFISGGILDSCFGVIMPVSGAGPVFIRNSTLDDLDLRLGGRAIVYNSQIWNIFAKPRDGRTFRVMLYGSRSVNVDGDQKLGTISADAKTQIDNSNMTIIRIE